MPTTGTDVPAARAEPLAFTASDGVGLVGWRWHPGVPPQATVVLVHGFVGDARSRDVLAHVEALVADGFAVVTYDARGHGASGGACTLGALERYDVVAAVRAARQGGADRIVLIGESMGAVAVLGCALEERVDGVVTVGAPARWSLKPNPSTLAAALLTQTGLGRRAARRWWAVRIHPGWLSPTPPVDLVAAIDVPLAVLHGQDDRFIPRREARLLHDAARGPCSLAVVAGMAHGFGSGSVEPVLRATRWVVETTADRAA